MPQVRVKGITEEKIIKVAGPISDAICDITGCPKEYVEIELNETKAVKGTDFSLPAPFIEIYWFDRGQEQSDKVARAITEILKVEGIEKVDIAFLLYSKNLYYEDGEHF